MTLLVCILTTPTSPGAHYCDCISNVGVFDTNLERHGRLHLSDIALYHLSGCGTLALVQFKEAYIDYYDWGGF